jgi:hypothetical protein
MKIKVESCWAGNSNFHFRLTALGGKLVWRVAGGTWNRSVASEALDLISSTLRVERKAVRFVHV